MSFQTFLFKRIDQLFIFTFITLFFVLIMYFQINKDEEEINKYIGQAFKNICDVNGLDSANTMGSYRDMYCNTSMDESLFAEFLLTYKLLYTSSYIYNINILDSLSYVLNNAKPYNASMHKILLILLYTLIFFLYQFMSKINGFIGKLFLLKKPKLKKKKKEPLGITIVKSFKNRLISFIIFIISISIFLNIFKYIYDIGVGMTQSSKLRGVFFVQIIILLFVLLFTGIFNIKPEGMKNKKKKPAPVLRTCKNNNKYLILIFFLIIPIVTGIQQFTTIIYRGFKGMSSNRTPQIKILFSTIFIMLLVLFNIEVLTNLGNSKNLNPLKT
jgi:hypothetical protein